MEQTTFTDSDGAVWTVREDGADDGRSLTTDASSGTTWLRFESDLEVRRLWHYPDDWRGLSHIQLESLLDRASTVIARFRPVAHRGLGRTAPQDAKGLSSAELRVHAQSDPASRDPSKRRDKP